MRGKQLVALTGLAEGMTIRQAAEHAKVSRKTLQRWLYGNEEFVRLLMDYQDQITAESLRILKANAAQAARVLVAAMAFSDVTAPQVKAADSILDRVHGRAILRVGGTSEDLPPLTIQLVHPEAQAALDATPQETNGHRTAEHPLTIDIKRKKLLPPGS